MDNGIEIVGFDGGNANVKVDGRQTVAFPHALLPMTDSEVSVLMDDDANAAGVEHAWRVERKHGRDWKDMGWFMIGQRAMRSGKGSVKFGAARYTDTYFGVLAAIGLFQCDTPDGSDVLLGGSHTPDHRIYKQNMIDAAMGQWRVTNPGMEKGVRQFNIRQVFCLDEPVAAYRHATISDANAGQFHGEEWLRSGVVIVLDIGGLTTGVSVVEQRRVDYSAGASDDIGMLDVLDELAKGIRKRYVKELTNTPFLNMHKVRNALRVGKYDAGGYGMLDVKQEAERARGIVLNRIPALYTRFGGKAEYNGVLLAGGGSADMATQLKELIDHPNIAFADPSMDQLHFSTARGSRKVLRTLYKAGKIKV